MLKEDEKELPEELKEAMNEILQKELTKEEKEYIVMILKYSNKVIKFIPKERKNYIYFITFDYVCII